MICPLMSRPVFTHEISGMDYIENSFVACQKEKCMAWQRKVERFNNAPSVGGGKKEIDLSYCKLMKEGK